MESQINVLFIKQGKSVFMSTKTFFRAFGKVKGGFILAGLDNDITTIPTNIRIRVTWLNTGESMIMTERRFYMYFGKEEGDLMLDDYYPQVKATKVETTKIRGLLHDKTV